MSFKVLISDPLAEEGVEILRAFCDVDVKTGLSEDELVKIIGDYDGLLVRSGTQVTARIIEAADKLKFIGRAGAGVDNIEMEPATKRGIIVANAPAGNTLAACEHTVAMMMSLVRNIPQATASVKKGEWKRSQFMGIEVNGKTLGIAGFGRIGQELSKRANAMAMKVIAYDPYMNYKRAEELGVTVVTLEELFKMSDIITVHTPLIKETKHMINRETIATMKDGVRIINCARGGIIDEDALYDAIVSGKVAGAALDVYEEEPPKNSKIIELPQVINTPHLGASTVEAQKNVAVSVAEQCIEVLKGGSADFVVNAPIVAPDMQERIKPYAEIAQKMGKLISQIVEGRITSVEIEYAGKAAEFGNGSKYITRVVVKGIMDTILQTPANIVNAEFAATEHSIKISESISPEAHGFANLITITLKTDRMSETISGNVLAPDKVRIVKIGDYMTDLTPSGSVIVSYHHDKPGVIGAFGTIAGKYGINIAGMQVGRNNPGEDAVMVLNVDSEVPQNVMDEFLKIDGVKTAKYARI
ncbi:MAG: phosphoglycerate dehydrogenase [Methanomicrobium sp.]|uniref:phosphoglycerate dehydrogenase n=1 Tax=Methanomicrobium mobile TaxID=2205 RepID=UPI0005B274B7|nr:phosphoglycerate dehydrogenase [Methanomicrobium mobile]MBO7388409.1 phosphoglycerate dehydrogenase [Methanomicrobium sp.]